MASAMLQESHTQKGFASFLREMTIVTPPTPVDKTITFVNSLWRHRNFRHSSGLILRIARLVRAILPFSMQAYRIKPGRTGAVSRG
jgi:hypothetical protein